MADALALRLRLVRRDGGLLRAELRFEAVRDAAGAIAEHRVTVRDVSHGRGADELRAQWEVLFRVTRRGIAVTDARTHRIAVVNPAYAAMHGRPVEDFVGLPVADVLTPEAAARIGALADRIDEAGFVSYESEHVRPDGNTFPAAVEVMAARDEHGEQLYWLAWVEDLTERRRADRDAAHHADEMARSHAELDRFAGVVSHDLQSPMRVIAGCARILERRAGDELDAEQRELLEHIVGGVHRMTALLDGIREWSRARGGDAPMGAVDAGAAVAEARSLLAADLEAADARVDVGELPVVHGHTAALVQLFQNLIANAVKFRGDVAARDRRRRRARGRRHVGVQRDGQRHRDRAGVRRPRVRVRPPPAQRRDPRQRHRPDRVQDGRRAPRRPHLGRAGAGWRQPLLVHAPGGGRVAGAGDSGAQCAAFVRAPAA